MSSSRPIDNPKDPRTDEKPVFSKELVQEDLKDELKQAPTPNGPLIPRMNSKTGLRSRGYSCGTRFFVK